MASDEFTSALLAFYSYDPETGLIWSKKVQRPIGNLHHEGYLKFNFKGRMVLAHRAAWVLMTGQWPAAGIDHRNGVKTDNRWLNLREATDAQNQQNRVRPAKHNKSGYLGVQVAGARFEACIRHQGRTIHLGTFDTAELAHAAYLARKREIHPFSTLAAAA